MLSSPLFCSAWQVSGWGGGTAGGSEAALWGAGLITHHALIGELIALHLTGTRPPSCKALAFDILPSMRSDVSASGGHIRHPGHAGHVVRVSDPSQCCGILCEPATRVDTV